MRSMTVIAALMLLSMGTASGEIPQVMGYQGRVTDNSGVPVADGTYTMRFRIYTAETGGTLLWDSNNQSAMLADGIFNVMLGESPQPALGLAFDQDHWLLVTFAGEDQTPRKRLGSVGYAYMASGLVPGTEVSGSVTGLPFAVIKGTNTATTGLAYGLWGETSSNAGSGIVGEAPALGVYGYASAPGGRGVYGLATSGSGYSEGVFGESSSTSGTGVHGRASAATGVIDGVFGDTSSPQGRGVYGLASATTGANYGTEFENWSTAGGGVCGTANALTGYTYGVYGIANSTSGDGVYGLATATTGNAYGVLGYSSSASGVGVLGDAHAYSGINYGVYGVTHSASGYGGFFDGDVHVTGDITKNNCYFLIDHPLDPENRLLRHSCVESPENLLIYRGTVTLNSRGEAQVGLPDYFVALVAEHEASVHVTPRGRPFVTGYDWNVDNSGVVLYGVPNREVSWMVLADRDDPVTRELARPVEENKGPESKYCDRGRLLYPSAYGYPETRARDHERREDKRHQPAPQQKE